MAATPNLIELNLKYRKYTGDLVKQDGTLYSSTDMSEGANEENSGAQTNREISELATDATNLFIDALAKTFEKPNRVFPSYAGLTRYIPEFMAEKSTSVELSVINGQLGTKLVEASTRAGMSSPIILASADLYGYPISARIESNNFTDRRFYTAHLSDKQYVENRESFLFDEDLEDPLYYLDYNGSETVVSLNWLPPTNIPLQDWPPGSGLQTYTGIFVFTYIKRQPQAILDSVDILLNPKYYGTLINIMVERNEKIRQITQQ